MSSVVGIDLGYQNSVIAGAGRGGVDVILNGNSNRLNPTMVGFDDSRKMGEQATSGMTSNYKNTVKAMKRLVGLTFDDARAQKEMAMVPVSWQPVKRAGGGPDSIGVKVTLHGEEKIVLVEAVLGMMVKHLGYIAARKVRNDSAGGAKSNKSLDEFFPQDWVIAIPNYYTDAQRRAVLNGCEICGITGVQRLIHENTATALAYGIFKDLKKEFTKDKPTNVMFIDMGASAYSVSIAAFEPGKFTVKSAYCDADLGGRSFDLAIAEWVAGEFEAKYKSKLSGKPMERAKSKLKLLAAAEKAKKTLSPQGVKEVRINIEMLMDDLDFAITLKADKYEEMCQPLLARLAGPITKCLAEAKLAAGDLAAVELVGGSTRIGCVKRKLLEVFGGGVKNLSTTMNADEAVARGAALSSAILSPRFKVLPYDICEAQPYPIQISWQDDEKAAGMEVKASSGAAPEATDSVVMFDRGLAFPIIRRVTLRRSGTFVVQSSYHESAVSDYGLEVATDICEFTIQAPKCAEGEEEKKVRVNVKQDIHGIVHLSSAQMVEEIEEEAAGDAAEEKDKAADGEKKEGEEGESKKKKVKKTNLAFSSRRPLSLSSEELKVANEMEVAMANNDRIVQETADMRNELESYIYDMRDKVNSESHYGPYGTDAEKATFCKENEAMENWLYEDGFDATKSVYSEKLQHLKSLGGPMEKRLAEAQGRPGAISQLKGNLEMYQKWVTDSQTDERYAHITDEEREKVRTSTDTISAWMYEMLDKQGNLPLYGDPVLTVALTNQKNDELTRACSPIMYKPKPKPTPPPAAPAPAPEAKKEESGDTAAGEPMDVDKENAEAPAPAEGGDAPMETDA